MIEFRESQSFLRPCRALAPRPGRRPWSNVLLCLCPGFSPAQVLLLPQCVERQVIEVFLSAAALLFPLLLRPFPPPQALSSFPRVLSFSLEASPASFLQAMSSPRAAALNRRLLQRLPRFSLPHPQGPSFPGSLIFRQRFR